MRASKAKKNLNQKKQRNSFNLSEIGVFMGVRNKNKILLGLFVCTLIVLVDQITKSFVVHYLGQGKTISISGFLNLICIYNKGITFGLLSGGETWQVLLIAFGISLVGIFLIKELLNATSNFEAIICGFIIGGAVGNLIDRAIYGAVVDFIDFHIDEFAVYKFHLKYWHWPAFNFADSMVVSGVSLLAWKILFCDKKRK